MQQERRLRIMLMVIFLAAVVLAILMPRNLFNSPTSFVLEDRHHQLLGATIAADGQWRFPARKEVPEKFVSCITTFEDKNFFLHNGIDLSAIARAAFKNITKGKKVQGASTITMQLIRLGYKNNRRNIWNKFMESLSALQLETEKTKEEILALYAANAPFGGNVVGLEAAAWRYYGKAPKNLSWGEMSALAVLPNAPSVVHPGKNRTQLLRKRNLLLNQLLARNIIDSSSALLAKMEPLPGAPLPLPQLAPHLLQRFRGEYKQHQHKTTTAATTINARLQEQVNGVLNERHAPLYANGIKNAAAIVLDVEKGEVLAYAGNVYNAQLADLQSDVDIIKAPRSAGSTLKPILYASALSEGIILPHSLLPDIPTRIGGYAPQNFDREYDGAVPASQAISRSLNIPSVRLLQMYKYGKFYELLKKTGISTFTFGANHYGLSMILGGSEVSLWDLARVYAGMARTLNHARQNKGEAYERDFQNPRFLQDDVSRKDFESKIAWLDATSVWFAFEAMKEVMRPGEEGLWKQFSSSQKISWKTGTSFGFRDGWSVGVTPRYVVAVWTGNANGEGRAGLIGVRTAAPIMFDIFKLLPNAGEFEKPQNHFDFIPVCSKSGFKAGPDCEMADTVLVPLKGSRTPLCKYHVTVHLDRTEIHQVTELCEDPAQMMHRKWFILPPAMEWYYKQKHYDYKTLPPFKDGCMTDEQTLELLYPMAGAKIYIPLEIDGNRGKAIFRAALRNNEGKIFWHIDEQYAGTTTGFHELAIDIDAGVHVLTLVAENGESIKRRFEIVNEER